MNIKNNKEDLFLLLKIDDNFISSHFHKNNFSKIVKNKNGKKRVINPPSIKLKEIQKVILKKILVKRKINSHSFGLSGNIIRGIEKHQKNYNNFLLNLDIENFFPSITYKNIFNIFLRMGYVKENAKVLTILTTFNKILPQGSPTSSYLSSLVLENFDKEISTICIKKILLIQDI